VKVCVAQEAINVSRCSTGILDVKLFVTDCTGDVTEDVEIPISKSVVKKSFGLLEICRGATNDVDHWNIFAVSSCNPVQSREFSHP